MSLRKTISKIISKMWDGHGWGREGRRTQKRNLHRRKSERENKPLFSKHGMQQQLNNESCKQCWEGVLSYSQPGGDLEKFS